jgi:glycosyltransferase involved in cell wall biosynthesis
MVLEKHKRLALITNWYPPKSGVAVNRMKAFANYLSLDYVVEVFCDGLENKTEIINDRLIVHFIESKHILDQLKSNPKDFKLLHNVKTALRILASKIWQEPLKNWKKETLARLKKVHEKDPFDIIVSSYAPKDPHQIALQFKNDFPNVKWLADMRDEMYLNQNIHGKIKLELKKLEEEIAEVVDGIISVSEPIVKAFKENYPHILFFDEIRNGFDFDRSSLLKSEVENNNVKIGYFGTFYGGRKPERFFNAIIEVQTDFPELTIEIHLVGTHKNFDIPSKLQNNVIMHPPMPYTKAIEFMHSMDANLLVEPISERKGIFTGKIFDYLAVKKPIIAIVDTTDVAADLIQEMNAGYIASFDDAKDQAEMISLFFKDFSNHKIMAGSEEQINTLHRKESVKKLSLFINKMLEG